jgi:hypothetical protein
LKLALMSLVVYWESIKVLMLYGYAKIILKEQICNYKEECNILDNWIKNNIINK